MRVALITETYAPQVNGVSNTLGHLVRHLRGVGDQVMVVHPRYHGEPPAEGDVAVQAARLPFYREVSLPQPPFWEAHVAVDRFGPDVVHVATEATLGISFLWHSQRRGWPIVSSFHTNFDQYTDHYGFGWGRWIVWRYLRWFHNQTAETYVPTPTVVRGLEARGFQRLAIWPRGVDAELFRPDRPGRERVREGLGLGPEAVLIGHVGRIAFEKNVGHLQRAFQDVAKRRPESRFLVVGGGPLASEFRESLGEVATFAGYRRGEDLADHFAACDVFAFASVTETFGNVVLEAMASGLPVVALRGGGVSDVVQDGETGALLPPEGPASQMADALVDLVDRLDERRRLSEGARAYALRQSWGEIMGRLRERYQRAISLGR